jgi:cephalosporin hydroxylase
MKLIIDTSARTLTTVDGDFRKTEPLYSREAFDALSLEWVRVGWSLKYYHNFGWFGCPVLQLPEDLVRMQEVIYRLRPDVIVETGVFKGGSLTFYASLFQALGNGRVIGVDIEIAPQVRQAIQSHFLAPRITLLEGNSASDEVVSRVKSLIRPEEKVFVILDSNHSKAHVRAELDAYSRFVTPGSYILAADGIMRDLTDVPGGEREWACDNPLEAAKEFAAAHPEFERADPEWPFRWGELRENVTYCPGGWLKRLR